MPGQNKSSSLNVRTWLATEEMARRQNYSTRIVARWISSRRLPSFYCEHTIRVSEGDLDNFLS